MKLLKNLFSAEKSANIDRLTCDQALFSFRLVNPFLRKHETKTRILASDPVRVNKSDAKIPPDRRLLIDWVLHLEFLLGRNSVNSQL